METRTAAPETEERIYRRLVDSPFYQVYRRAFVNATGLELALLPADEKIGIEAARDRYQSPFCRALNGDGESCLRCMREHRCLVRKVVDKAETVTCFAGMRESIVPVRSGDKTVAFLSTGQVFTARPKGRGFPQVAETLREFGVGEDRLVELETAWNETVEVGLESYEGAVTLLAAFALQLSDLLNRLLTEEANSEPQIVVKAKRYVNAHLEEKLSLDSVASHVGVSPFYFCKLFKQATEMTLTEYVNRRRIEWAKRRLANPNARITEVAFDVGFQSVSQFNRSFLKYVGVSPTRFRAMETSGERLEGARAA